MENKIINIYLTVCEKYNTILVAETQRFSNNFCPKFTDEEAITCYIFGILEQKLTLKSAYKFIKDYWAEWFPKLPSYQRFNKLVNFLAPAIELLAKDLLGQFSDYSVDNLLDSLPIVVANSKRSRTAKVASDICDKGYCASKSMYFYGVKLHGLAKHKPHSMPSLRFCTVKPASHSDITVAKQILQTAENINIYADKAYADNKWKAELAEQNVKLFTPVKLKKGQQHLDASDKLFSRAVSSIRQPIEGLFAWLQDKTHIQNASKIRSSAGLIAFIFARIAAYAFLIFYC